MPRSLMLVNCTSERAARENLPHGGPELAAAVIRRWPTVARRVGTNPYMAVGVGKVGAPLEIRALVAITLQDPSEDAEADAVVTLLGPQASDGHVGIHADGFPSWRDASGADPVLAEIGAVLAAAPPLGTRTPVRRLDLGSAGTTCRCGCSCAPAAGGRFLPGHDVRALRAMVKRHFRGSTAEALDAIEAAFGPGRTDLQPIHPPR